MIERAAQLVRAIPYGEVNRYTQLALASAVMNLGLPVLLHEWIGVGERAAVAVALVTAFVVNFLAARTYVFKASGAFAPQVVRFALASAAFRGSEYIAFLTLNGIFGLYYVLALAIVLAVSFALKFVLYRRYVFTPAKHDTSGSRSTRFEPPGRSPLSPWNGASDFFGGRDALLLAVLFAFYLFYPQQGFEGLIPDNIAQTAYFSLLSRPDLVGSIGSSSPKGGLIILLGVAHYLSYDLLGSAWPFKAMLAFFFAATLYLTGRVAAQIGGFAAGLLAVLVAAGSNYLTLTFFTGSSNLFFLPPVLLGLMLLSAGKDRAGIVSLCLAITIRPEAVVIVAFVIMFRCLRHGDWRKALEFSTYGALALVFFVAIAYWTQGAWDRVGGGAAAGYPAFESFRTIEHARKIVGQAFSERFVALLLLPALYTVLRVERARTYLYFYSMTLAFIVLVVIGFFGMHYRYIAAGQAIIFALGCGGLMRLYADLRRPDWHLPGASKLALSGVIAAAALAIAFWSTRSISNSMMVVVLPAAYLLVAASRTITGSERLVPVCHLAIVLLLASTAIASGVKTHQTFSALLDRQHPAIQDARDLLADPRIPRGSSVIAEDELLEYVLVGHPDFFARARSIQSFNVMTDAERSDALSEAEFLYVSKRRNYGWNYLFYFPRATWVTDPFRTAVLEMIRTNRPRRILGAILVPIYNSDTRFVASIHTLPAARRSRSSPKPAMAGTRVEQVESP